MNQKSSVVQILKSDPQALTSDNGNGKTLKVTNAGLTSIGIVPEPMPPANHLLSNVSNLARPVSRPGTKQAKLIALLEAPEGATMEVLIAATGWQAHTLRGAISRALGKKPGLTVTSAKEEGRARVYRISRGAM
jgi:hypothetical protein